MLVLLAHVLALWWLGRVLQPASLLREVAPPFYTRTLAPTAATVPAPAESMANQPSAPAKRRSTAIIRVAKKPSPNRPEIGIGASAPDTEAPPDTPAEPMAAASEPTPTHAATAAPAAVASAPEAVVAAPAPPPAAPASRSDAADLAHLERWPADTRLTYRLSGNFRGELHGNAAVLWQRDGARYQSVVQLDIGFLLNSRFSSQGEITPQGLRPGVYEEQTRGKRRSVRLEDDGVRLDNGDRVPRPQDVQDTASQFVELGHRFATGRVKLEPGQQVNFWLARPGGVDQWTYDVVGEETVHLPRLGAVRAVHLKPRPLAKPRGPITAEMWFAPSLQYLPVRIRLTSGPDTYVDLMVETIEQK